MATQATLRPRPQAGTVTHGLVCSNNHCKGVPSGCLCKLVNSLPSPAGQTSPTPHSSRVATILLVDNDAEARLLLRHMLEDMGHAVMETSNVEHALALVRKTTPTIILSATQLSGEDGFDLCRRLQQDQALRHLPLALITDDDFNEPNMGQFAKDVGAVAVLMRPVTSQDLRALIDVWISVRSVPDATQKLRRLDSEEFHERHSKELIKQLETKVADLQQLARRYKLLSATRLAVVRAQSRAEFACAICRTAVDHAGLRLVAVVLTALAGGPPEIAGSHSEAADASTGFDAALAEFMNASRGLSADTLRSGQLVVVNDIANDPTTASLRETARRAGIGAMALCPLRNDGTVVGAAEFFAPTSAFFNPATLQLFNEMAHDVEFGLHNLAREARHEDARRRLVDALEYNRVLIEASPIGIFTCNETGDFVSINSAAENLTGRSVTQIAPRNIRGIESWKASGLLSLVEQALATNTVADREFHISSATDVKDVKDDWIRARIIPFEFRSERHLLAMLSNIQERHEVERALAEAEAKYRALVETQSLIGIFLVDEHTIFYHNGRAAEMFGYQPGELVGQQMKMHVVDEDWPTMDGALRQVFCGKVPFLNLEFRGRRKNGTEVLLSAHGTLGRHNGQPTLFGVLLDVTDQRSAEQQIKLHVAQLENALMRTVEVATTLSEIRDPYTAGHERRVAEIAVAIGVELGFDERRQQGLRIAGSLHDVGKMGIPTEILSKPGRLTAIEYSMVKGHAQASYEILKNVEFPWPVAQIALQHHERMDGSGYPQGLKGEDILLEARIMAVADTVEAMSSHRPYRAGLGIDKALVEIERGRGSAYDPVVVDACLNLFREKDYKMPRAD